MNETISAVLHEHAGGDIRVEALLDAVHTGARRRRQRRLARLGGAAVLGVVTATVIVTARVPSPAPPVEVGAPPVAFPRPPSAPLAPTLARRPEVLGSDPALFHLDVSGLAGITDFSGVSWSSQTGHEELAVVKQADDLVRIAVDRQRDRLDVHTVATWPVRVGDQAAEATSTGRSFAVRWQPLPGVWALVEATESIQLAIDLAERLRLDHVFRCAVPFRLVGLASARVVRCGTYLPADGTRGWGQAWVRLGTSHAEYQVAIANDDAPVVPNDTVGGRPVQVTQASGSRPFEVRYAYDGRVAYVWVWPDGPVDPSAVASIVAAFTPVSGDDPRAWPDSPLR